MFNLNEDNRMGISPQPIDMRMGVDCLCSQVRTVSLDPSNARMQTVCIRCISSSPLGKALDYAYKLWPRLGRYVLDGRYQIDNNAVERSLHPSWWGVRTICSVKTIEQLRITPFSTPCSKAATS